MKFNVHMLAFEDGEIREVDVPESECGGDVFRMLDKIFYFGQNDFQPIPDRCSVSAGDVIEYEVEFYLVLMVGFRKISKEQFEHYKKTNRHTRLNYMIE